MNKDQLIHKIHADFAERIQHGRLLDQVEDYIRNYFKSVNEGIQQIKKHTGSELAVEFDDRNAFASILIKDSSIQFYRRQDRIDIVLVRNGSKREDQIIVMDRACLSRMYQNSIQEAMEQYMAFAFQ